MGTPGQGAWSQVHHFIPDQKEKFDRRGELILLVSLGEISQDLQPESVGREVISRFHEEYYGNLTGKPMAALEAATAKVSEEKSQFFDKPGKVSLTALAIWKNVAYLSIYEQGKILLRRNDKTVSLLESVVDKPVSASGFVKPGDIFIIGTTDIFETLPEGMLSSAIKSEDLEKAVEILAPVVHAREGQGQLAIAFAQVEETEEEIKFSQPEPKEKSKKEKTSDRKRHKKLPKIKFNFGPAVKFFKSKLSTLTVAILFLGLLGVSIFFGWKKRLGQQQEARIADLSTQIEKKLADALAVKNLDPEGSLKLINEAREINEELADLDEGKSNSYQQRMGEIKENLGEKPAPANLYYDLNLIGENVDVQSIDSDGESAVIFDTGGERIIEVNLNEKSGEIIAGGDEISGSGQIVRSQERTYVVKNDIYWIEDEELEELYDLDDEFNVVSAAGWLGNLYLLDIGGEEVWKLPSITESIGGPRSWLSTSTGLDFDKLADMSIDGSIYFLSETGQIFKYLSGEKEEFDQQLPEGIGRAEYLSVALEGERLVFWDSGNKIVWLFSKTGSFLARQPMEVEDVRGLAISPDGTQVFLFGKDKIYLVEFSL